MFLKLTIFACIFVLPLTANPICNDGYTLVNDNKCWKLFYFTETGPAADEICRTRGGGILATLKNAIDNRGLLTFLNDTNINRVWLGLKCTGLSPSTCQWDDTTSVQYSSFSSGFPNHRFGECVYYSADGYPAGQWASGECDDSLPFVCELPTTGVDRSNYDCDVNYNYNCYKRSNDLVPFSYAQGGCTHRPSGNLASIHSYLENRFITSLYKTTDNVWIGGLAPGSGLIVWTDGTKNDYYNLKRTLNGTCVSMSFTKGDRWPAGYWSAGDCGVENISLCKRPIKV